MSPETVESLFKICNTAVLPFWMLLWVAPRARVTALLVHGPLVPALLGAVYVVGLLTLGPRPGNAGFFELSGVMQLFAQPQGVLIGWVHYLIFDLFIGAWEVRDAARLRIPHWAVVPCSLATLMLGPIGLLLYLILRAAMRQRLSLREEAA